ncbi:hypothetical protein EKO27_g6147 [Xylaria grammica]|uniref:Heterokaryon incompatibility domain-containing protein n=1 Tax=Xylaria grammica TaxID=363999 RepID=A0A439D3H5_9PEZI|nr:hypothetical protein EKO27_g6147 [Xylaria grammica]
MADYDPVYRPFPVDYKSRSIQGAEKLVGRVLQKGWYTIVEFVLLASSDNPAAEIFPRRPFSDTFMTDDVMDSIVNWIQTCCSRDGHDGCWYDGKPQLPTRVIDVTAAEPDSIRIHNTDEGECDDYVTLSYCWGGPQPLTANSNTMTQLMNGTPLSVLPSTVRDAVLTTRRLGFRYLWIDALCIIQDNEDDKKREIGKMGQIYRNATITIVAAHSRSATGGFLKPDLRRTQTPSFPMVVRIPGPDTNSQVILALGLSTMSRVQPLVTRGWAFQESMLSMRLVTFSEFEVYCECNLKSATLILNDGSRSHASIVSPHEKLYAPDGRLSNELQQAYQDHGPGWMDADFLANAWEMIVTQFTRRALTFPDDRLPGVRGLASELLKHLSPGVGGDYVVGVFTGCLPRLLLWSKSNVPGLLDWPEGHENPRLQQVSSQVQRSKRAPTWSWACVDYPVIFYTDEWDVYNATISVIQDPSSLGVEEAAQVSALGLTGMPILEIESELLQRGKDEFEEDRSSGTIQAAMDLEVNRSVLPEEGVWYLFLSKNIGPEEWAPSESGPTAKGPLRYWYASGIIVQQLGKGLYRRQGYFRRDYDGSSNSDELLGSRQRIKLV